MACKEEALENLNAHHHPEIQLITDGGPENKLQALLDTIEQPITHKVALADVHYSNSLIEAVFKTSKYNYLYRMDIPDENALRTSFAFTVDNFNNRPHISLKGLTPNEAERNIALNKEELCLNIKSATVERRKYNQAHRCTQCKP